MTRAGVSSHRARMRRNGWTTIGVGLAGVLAALACAAPAAAQGATCDPASVGDDRQLPYCYNRPGTELVNRSGIGTNVGFNVQALETTSGCPRADGDTPSWGATAWYAFHPHVAGILVVEISGIDAQLVLEEGAGAPSSSYARVCSDDSGTVTTNSERLAVGGLVAGRAYLLQIGGFEQTDDSIAQGEFELKAEFFPDRDADNVPDSGDPCPDAAAPGTGCPAPAPPSPAPAPAPDPDPDSDGVRGAADRCPTVGTGGRDGNLDGCPDKRRQSAGVKWRIVPTAGRGVIIQELRLSGLRSGTRVRVRCSRGCRGTTVRPRRSRLTVSARRLRAGRVAPGATIEVRVTRKGYNGEVHRFKVMRTTMVEAWTRCLPEGKSRPVKGGCY